MGTLRVSVSQSGCVTLELAIHVPLHSDDALFGFVFHGIEGTGMPACGERYGELDTWHVINFIQTLPEAARS